MAGPSETRCYLETDAGFTKANIYEPSGNKHYYCIYFARGCCHLGAECGYLHVIPTDKDEKRSVTLRYDHRPLSRSGHVGFETRLDGHK